MTAVKRPTRGSTAVQASYRELANVLGLLDVHLAAARRARGLSLRGAAAETGLSASTLGRIENGQDCSLINAIIVLNWLDQTATPAETEVRTWIERHR